MAKLYTEEEMLKRYVEIMVHEHKEMPKVFGIMFLMQVLVAIVVLLDQMGGFVTAVVVSLVPLVGFLLYRHTKNNFVRWLDSLE